MIVGLVLVLLIPVTILYARYSSESSYAITTSKINAITNEIVGAANQVNVYGADTQVTLRIDFPRGLQSINIIGNEIIFTIKGKGNEISEIVKVSDAPLSSYGAIPVTPGKKNVVVKSLGNSVLINIQCDGGELTCGTPAYSGCGNNGCVLECANGAWNIKEVCTGIMACENARCGTL